MQVPSVAVGQVGRCKSASAADFQFCSHWRSGKYRPERLHIASCTENTASERPQKLAARLSLAHDGDELMRIRRPHNNEFRSGSLAACCMPSRPVSSHVVVAPFHTECHCVACCSCSPFDRRSINCPVFTFPVHPVSVRRARSLDSGLAQCHSCSQHFTAAEDSVCDDVEDSVQNSAGCDAVIHKSSSVPACCSSQMRYYNAGISFDSLSDDAFQTCNTDVDSASTNSNSTLTYDDAEVSSVVTHCPDESQVPDTETPCINYLYDEVSPDEYHKRFKVRSFTTDASKCSCACVWL